jgi:hypothetical protein
MNAKQSTKIDQPGTDLLLEVRVGLAKNGTSLHKWALENGLKHQNARAVLVGLRNGPKARADRQRLIQAAGL